MPAAAASMRMFRARRSKVVTMLHGHPAPRRTARQRRRHQHDPSDVVGQHELLTRAVHVLGVASAACSVSGRCVLCGGLTRSKQGARKRPTTDKSGRPAIRRLLRLRAAHLSYSHPHGRAVLKWHTFLANFTFEERYLYDEFKVQGIMGDRGPRITSSSNCL